VKFAAPTAGAALELATRLTWRSIWIQCRS
jgi:hypothetical protein